MDFNLKEISEAYGLGSVFSVRENKKGLVNKTYFLETESGKFVAQKLNPLFSEGVVEDHDAVQKHLKKHGFLVPEIVLTLKGEISLRIEGELWKVCRYIEHDEHPLRSNETIIEAAQKLGKFHSIMKTLKYKPVFALPDFHNTPQIIATLNQTIESPHYRVKAEQVRKLHYEIISSIEKHYLSPQREQTLIHGDPKFDNFLFKNGRAIGMVDLDTVMLGHEFLDIGDAFRSWCRTNKTEFDEELFNAACESYLHAHRLSVSKDEIRNATALITLELAARYLIDYFEESYFDWKKEKYKTRAEQNLARAKRYTEYYKNIFN